MKIVKNFKIVVSRVKVSHEKETYIREAYNYGKICWFPDSYDGECNESELEKEFQKLITINGE